MIEIQIVHDGSYAESLAHIMIVAWRAGFHGILKDAVIERYTEFCGCKAMFTQILASGVGTMYLAAMDETPVGLLYWLGDGEVARIEAILTIPEVWGQGVAATLIERVLADAKAAGCSEIHVWPFVENHRARHFYEKNGFRSSGQTRMGDAPEMEYIKSL